MTTPPPRTPIFFSFGIILVLVGLYFFAFSSSSVKNCQIVKLTCSDSNLPQEAVVSRELINRRTDASKRLILIWMITIATIFYKF